MDDNLDASSSQASLHSLSCSKGRGGHISALRSLGLLHELQEYVTACVETQQQQEKELGRLKAEKKEAERALKQRTRWGAENPARHAIQQFQASEICDLPPRLRALFEDNKVLKEQSRRYKHRCQEVERHAASLEQQLLAAQSLNSKLKLQLQEGHVGQNSEVLQAQQQAEGLAKALEKLQHAHEVLQQKLETDARLHRQALASASRERQQVEKQVQELQEQLERRDKDARASALAAKQAQHKLDEAKSAAAKAVAGVNTRVAQAVAAAEARCKQAEDAKVHLMLCIVTEPSSSSKHQHNRQHQQQQAAEQHEADSASNAAAGSIWADDFSGSTGKHGTVSSCYTGDLSRQQAVLRLQAGARGYLVRKHLKGHWQQQEQGLVVVQTGQQLCSPGVQLDQADSSCLAPQSCGSTQDTSSMLLPLSGPQALPTCFRAPTDCCSLPPELPALDVDFDRGQDLLPSTQLPPRAEGAVAPAEASACTEAEASGVLGSTLRQPARQRVSAAPGTTRSMTVPGAAGLPASAPHTRPTRPEGHGRQHQSSSGRRSLQGATAGALFAAAGTRSAEADAAAAIRAPPALGLRRVEGSSSRSRPTGSFARPGPVMHSARQQQQQQSADRERRLSLQPHPPLQPPRRSPQ